MGSGAFGLVWSTAITDFNFHLKRPPSSFAALTLGNKPKYRLLHSLLLLFGGTAGLVSLDDPHFLLFLLGLDLTQLRDETKHDWADILFDFFCLIFSLNWLFLRFWVGLILTLLISVK